MKTIAVILGAIVLAAGLVLAGSSLYWFAEGKPGTPGEFRERVAEAGLSVQWANSGPRGGGGIVETDCGPTHVDVYEVDGDLFLEWGDEYGPLTPAAIDRVMRCAS